MEKEIWKDIQGYEGLYQISSLGRVKSLSNDKKKKEKILVSKTKGNVYNVLALFKKGDKKRFFVHRLVANAFIENNKNRNEVNHIDGNKNNNCVSNLEWCTHSENMQHAHDTKLFDDLKISKKVFQYDENFNLIRIWDSAVVVSKELGFCKENISRCCRDGIKCKGYGYIWSYKKIRKERKVEIIKNKQEIDYKKLYFELKKDLRNLIKDNRKRDE